MSQTVWELHWSVEHTRPEAPYDAVLEPPLGDDENAFWPMDPNPSDQPFREPTVFGTVFSELAETDYPSNDLDWPLVSRAMLKALQVDNSPSITAFPVRMIDTEVRDDDPRGLLDLSAEEAVTCALSQRHLVRDDFLVLHVQPLVGVFDAEASQYKPFSDGTGVWLVNRYVFKEPAEGFPPLFRLAEVPTQLFITREARERLRRAGVRGPVYRIPAGPPARDEVDHPVLL